MAPWNALVLVGIATVCVVYRTSARADEAPPGSPVLIESLEGGVYRLQSSFAVSADPHLTWQVLTDYSGMPHFVPSIRSSVPQALSDGGLVVAQEFEGKAFIFTRTLKVRLIVQEQPERQITFRDVALRDFNTYQGSWELQPSGEGTQVVYRLTAEPRESVPGIVGRGAFKDGATQMLIELRGEMLRRSQRQPPSKSEQPEGSSK
jgi:hypothetical protein